MQAERISIPMEETLTGEQRETFDEIREELGRALHDLWREPRRQEDGTFEPRIKTTQDSAWIEENGGENTVDIANTSFEDLPQDWQEENRASALSATMAIYESGLENKEFTPEVIEKMSSKVHDSWLERNSSWVPEEQKLPYEALSEEEKRKDRVIVEKGLELLGNA